MTKEQPQSRRRSLSFKPDVDKAVQEYRIECLRQSKYKDLPDYTTAVNDLLREILKQKEIIHDN